MKRSKFMKRKISWENILYQRREAIAKLKYESESGQTYVFYDKAREYKVNNQKHFFPTDGMRFL